MPTCTLRDGCALSYADAGVGAPILLLHGWGTHSEFFQTLIERLARTHRVIAPTFRAHPGSTRGAAPLSIETLGEDVAELCEKLDLRGVVALGWSMGAMALWAAAARLGERLKALIVEDMGPKLVNDDSWAHGLAGGYTAKDIIATLAEIEADWPAYVARFAPRMFAPHLRERRPDLLAWTSAEMSKADPAAMAAYWASMAAQDFRAALSHITQPMLVIHGGESQVYPDGATKFVADAAPNGARVIIAGAGHVPHLEAPDAFFNKVEEFVRLGRPDLKAGGGAVP